MGRHSSPQQWPFYRSVAGWFLPWLLLAIVVGAGVFFTVGALGGDLGGTPRAAGSPTPSRVPSPTPSETQSPTPAPSPTPSPEPTETADAEVELITEGITVQVLNGTGDADADDRMADRLAGLGYEVVSIEGSSRPYGATTVFWSYPDARRAAQRLAQRFGWVAEVKPANLSASVALHVVVGSDEI